MQRQKKSIEEYLTTIQHKNHSGKALAFKQMTRLRRAALLGSLVVVKHVSTYTEHARFKYKKR